MTVRALLAVFSACLLAGCAATSGPRPASPPQPSAALTSPAAFLPDPSLLQPVAGHPGMKRYIQNDLAAARRQIDSVHLAPVEVWLDPASPYQGLTQNDIATLDRELRKALLADTDRAYPLVDTPTANSLIVRVALTNVQLTRDRTKLLSFTPVGLVIQGVKAASGVSPIRVDRMGVQAFGFLQADTEKPLFEVSIEPSSSLKAPSAPDTGTPRLDEVAPQLAALAAQLRATLQGAR